MNTDTQYDRLIFRYKAVLPIGAQLATVIRVQGPNPNAVLKAIASRRRIADTLLERTKLVKNKAPAHPVKPSIYTPTADKIVASRAELRRASARRSRDWCASVENMPPSEKLVKWRDALNLSQRDVARRLGVARGAYAMVEKNTRKSPDLRVRAAVLFGKKQGVDW